MMFTNNIFGLGGYIININHKNKSLRYTYIFNMILNEIPVGGVVKLLGGGRCHYYFFVVQKKNVYIIRYICYIL